MDLNSSQRKKFAKWIVGIVAVCILIYLGVKNVNILAKSVRYVFRLFEPLVVGIAYALILNVPMRFFEGILWKKSRKKFAIKARRPVAFLLSLVMILSILTGVIWLVIPELVEAGTIIVKGAIKMIKELDNIDKSSELYKSFESVISRINWDSITSSLQGWLANAGSSIMNTAFGTVTVLVEGIFNFVLSFIFAIYILFSKETLKAQCSRLIRAWLPESFGEWIVHACGVASGIFRNFVSGQTLEALILGMLCMVGMLILGIPYAPMVGALVGVTALIPVVGAFIGAAVGGFMILTVSPIKALIFVIFLIVLQQLEGNIIYPKVMGARVNLPALWILCAVTVGGAIAGPVGMLLGVPFASTAYVLVREATADREEKIKADKILEENSESTIELD